MNACYGGTAAFLNCVNYCANPCNKGKKAICVIVDIAAYARGAARPTSGSGAVAVLVGEDSWLKFGGVKASWTEDVWDFYKADHEVEYPQVDGKVSQECYFRSLRGCYEGFRKEVSERIFHRVMSLSLNRSNLEASSAHSTRRARRSSSPTRRRRTGYFTPPTISSSESRFRGCSITTTRPPLGAQGLTSKAEITTNWPRSGWRRISTRRWERGWRSAGEAPDEQ